MGDFLGDVFGQAEPATEEAVEATPEVVSEPVAETPPESPPENAPEPATEPVVEKKADDHVPLAKYLDQRDELKELRRWKQEQTAQQQQQAQPKPDLYDMQPDEVAAYVERIADQRATATKFEMSDVIAKQTHGEEAVKAAVEWASEKAQADPVFAASYMRSPHPIDYIVQQHKRDSLYSQLPTDISSLDEYIEREIAKRGLPAVPAATIPVAAQQAPKPSAPPRSIASDTPSQAPVTPEGDKDSFLGIFDRK